jgi:hypothetical protein
MRTDGSTEKSVNKIRQSIRSLEVPTRDRFLIVDARQLVKGYLFAMMMNVVMDDGVKKRFGVPITCPQGMEVDDNCLQSK